MMDQFPCFFEILSIWKSGTKRVFLDFLMILSWFVQSIKTCEEFTRISSRPIIWHFKGVCNETMKRKCGTERKYGRIIGKCIKPKLFEI